jgi:hypothetical protein
MHRTMGSELSEFQLWPEMSTGTGPAPGAKILGMLRLDWRVASILILASPMAYEDGLSKRGRQFSASSPFGDVARGRGPQLSEFRGRSAWCAMRDQRLSRVEKPLGATILGFLSCLLSRPRGRGEMAACWGENLAGASVTAGLPVFLQPATNRAPISHLPG